LLTQLEHRSSRCVRHISAESLERGRGWVDGARLGKIGLADLERRAREATAPLRQAHVAYVEVVSAPDWAISLELAAVLDALCRTLQPKRVADLGSGFSSYVLRRYAVDASREAVSVDSDAAWLNRTREFLERSRLPIEGLVEWRDFVAGREAPFDLVLDDLGSVEGRIDTIPFVLELVRPSGFVIFDDCHRANLRSALEGECRARRNPVFSLRRATLDGFGRYAYLVQRRGVGAHTTGAA
jgi:predicted O-methyltransferase YrrM